MPKYENEHTGPQVLIKVKLTKDEAGPGQQAMVTILTPVQQII